LSGKLGSLLAIGTSICGVSAIAAGRRAIRARDSDVGYAIAAILALGAVALFTLPAIGHGIGLSDHEFGLWSGLAVDNTAETTAIGYLYSDHAGKIAVLVKSTRNALIGFVVLGFGLYWAGRGKADELAPRRRAKAAFIWAKFPKFVLGFLAVSAPATAHWIGKAQLTSLGNVDERIGDAPPAPLRVAGLPRGRAVSVPGLYGRSCGGSSVGRDGSAERVDPGRWPEPRDLGVVDEDVPILLMHHGVVVPAQQKKIAVVGHAAFRPFLQVVGLAPGRWPVTPRKSAPAIP
jgi:hypothetical protein